MCQLCFFHCRIDGMMVQGEDISPIQHLVLAKNGNRDVDMKFLQSIVEKVNFETKEEAGAKKPRGIEAQILVSK